MQDDSARFDRLIGRSFASEGGYEDDPLRIDQPTNMGITQPTLDRYNAEHPRAGFPLALRDLCHGQARAIYYEYYYAARRIWLIADDRIAFAVMDIGIMSGPDAVGRTVQKSLCDIGRRVVVDGVIGADTRNELNSLSETEKRDFMERFKLNRLAYLRTLGEKWEKYGKGWTTRTMAY